MTDIVERLLNWLNQSQQEQHETAIEAADAIQRLREENERLRADNQRYRTSLLGICRPVWSTPPIDSEAANVYARICAEMIDIAQFALAATTANTTANTSDATTNETDAKP